MPKRDRVIFRKLDGEIIALFPSLPGTEDWRTCLSYQHVGQHAAATPDIGGPAKPEEWADLAAELAAIGYNLDVRKRATLEDTRRRLAALLR